MNTKSNPFAGSTAKALIDIADLITSTDAASNDDKGKSFISDLLWLVDHSRDMSVTDYKALVQHVNQMYGVNA